MALKEWQIKEYKIIKISNMALYKFCMNDIVDI